MSRYNKSQQNQFIYKLPTYLKKKILVLFIEGTEKWKHYKS